MMEMLQGWLLGLTAAALAVSLLTAMLPKGETIRRIAGLAGGLILLLAVVQPLLRVRWEELTWRYETYQREMDRQTEAYQAAYADSLSGDIADRTAAYISEKAASLGIDCRVQVEVRTEDGLPLPYGASLDVERDRGAVGLHGAGAGYPGLPPELAAGGVRNGQGKAEGYLPEIPGRGAGAAGGPFAAASAHGQEQRTGAADERRIPSSIRWRRRSGAWPSCWAE